VGGAPRYRRGVTWLRETAAGAGGDGDPGDELARVFGLRPDLYAAWQRFTALLGPPSGLDPARLELCRLRIAALLGARHPLAVRDPAARAAGLGEARIAALDAGWASPAFDATERACLRFAEQFALDPKGISDADAADVVGVLGEAGMVAFVQALAVYDGFARFCNFFDVAPSGAGR
jgi:alkylhydroperoxidase family enzyme